MHKVHSQNITHFYHPHSKPVQSPAMISSIQMTKLNYSQPNLSALTQLQNSMSSIAHMQT